MWGSDKVTHCGNHQMYAGSGRIVMFGLLKPWCLLRRIDCITLFWMGLFYRVCSSWIERHLEVIFVWRFFLTWTAYLDCHNGRHKLEVTTFRHIRHKVCSQWRRGDYISSYSSQSLQPAQQDSRFWLRVLTIRHKICSRWCRMTTFRHEICRWQSKRRSSIIYNVLVWRLAQTTILLFVWTVILTNSHWCHKLI